MRNASPRWPGAPITARCACSRGFREAVPGRRADLDVPAGENLWARADHSTTETRTMSMQRLGIVPGNDGLPIISKAVIRGDTVYLCGVTPDPVGDVAAQTRQVLDRIDRLLQAAGTDKSKLITAQVWLADMADFAAHNAVWNEWVDRESPPVRACVGAALWRPQMRVEIMVTAAR
jgi:enamine deaminase RidA (YjgF/YER057c/UK114 family)